jgi:hypothetical protein
MQPPAKDFAHATRVVIVPMTAARAQATFPVIRGLAGDGEVFVVVSEGGRPLLVTDTYAEALRQVRANARVTLAARN